MALSITVNAEHEIQHLLTVISAHVRDVARLVGINAALEKCALEFQEEIEKLKARISELEAQIEQPTFQKLEKGP